MFSDDPCSNALRWVQHAIRATPTGCRLAHFSFTADSVGGCETTSRYSVLSKRPSPAPQAEKAKAPKCSNARKEMGSRERRQIWRAHRRNQQQKKLLSTLERLKSASCNDDREEEAETAHSPSTHSAPIEMDNAEQAAPPSSPPPQGQQQILPRHTASIAAPSLLNQAVCFGGTVQVPLQDKHHCKQSPDPNPEPQALLPPISTKRQKTYAEAAVVALPAPHQLIPAAPPVAVYPILSTVTTPNGTRGSFAGEQSITPGGEHAAFWMEPDNVAAMKEIKQLTFLP